MQHVTCEENMKRESSATCLKRTNYHQVRLSWLYQPAKNREFHFFGIFPQSARFSSLKINLGFFFHTSLCDLPRSFAIQLWQLWQFVGSFLRKAAVKKILGIEDSHWNPQATSAEMGGGRFEDLSKSLNPTYQFWVSILYISQNFIKNTVDSRWNTIACSEHLPIYR